MAQGQLATTGIETIRTGGPAPDHYQVFGERCSGTNFVSRLIGKNGLAEKSDAYGWKHGFTQGVAFSQRALIVGVVREPLAWLRSLYDKPWHTVPAFQALDFPGFLRTPWDSHVDQGRYFPRAERRGQVGQVLQQDRHPITGAMFEDVFALRAAKAQALLGLRARGVNLALVRVEAVQADPEGFLALLAATFDLPMPADRVRPVNKRLGSNFAPAIATRAPLPEVIAPEEMALIRARLDRELEAELGYALP